MSEGTKMMRFDISEAERPVGGVKVEPTRFTFQMTGVPEPQFFRSAREAGTPFDPHMLLEYPTTFTCDEVLIVLRLNQAFCAQRSILMKRLCELPSFRWAYVAHTLETSVLDSAVEEFHRMVVDEEVAGPKVIPSGIRMNRPPRKV